MLLSSTPCLWAWCPCFQCMHQTVSGCCSKRGWNCLRRVSNHTAQCFCGSVGEGARQAAQKRLRCFPMKAWHGRWAVAEVAMSSALRAVLAVGCLDLSKDGCDHQGRCGDSNAWVGRSPWLCPCEMPVQGKSWPDLRSSGPGRRGHRAAFLTSSSSQGPGV